MNQTHPSIDQIVDYLHGELAPADDAAMHAHLAGCPSCDRRRADEAAITEMLRAHARAQERELPAPVAAKIRSRIANPALPSGWERLRRALRPIYLVPAAAAIAAAIALYAFVGRPVTNAPIAIDASYYVENHAAMAAAAPFAADAPPATLTLDDEKR
jgi:anti-sigma factor RsiW